MNLIHWEQKMFNLAEQEFKKEIEISPAFSDAHFNLGILYQETGRDSLMLKSWERVLEINPDNQRASNALARYYKNKN